MDAVEIFMAGMLSGFSGFFVFLKILIVWKAVSAWFSRGIDVGD